MDVRRSFRAGIIVASLAATPVSAQQTERSSTTPEPADSCGVPPTMRTENWLDDWALFLAVVLAPPLMLTFLEDCDDRAHLNVTRDGVFASVEGGGFFSEPAGGWQANAAVSGILRGVLAEVALDRFRVDGRTADLRRYRIGYLFRPIRSAAGGVVLGYSDVVNGPDGWKLSGWELGLPMIASVRGKGSPLWIRAEPRYLLTPDGPNVMMDLGLWGRLPNMPIVLGVTGTMTSREDDPFRVGLSVGQRIGPGD